MHIRLIGCGAMGSAMATSLGASGKKVSLYDKHREISEKLSTSLSAPCVNEPLQDSPDMLILAIKPQDFATTAKALSAFKGRLIVSVVAGVSIKQLQTAFPHTKVLRMMPNLAVRYGEGIVSLAEDLNLADLKSLIDKTFSCFGLLHWFSETLFDAATAFGGSGPAFIMTLLESMVDAGIAMGLSSQISYDLAKQMIKGSISLLEHSENTPSEITKLKWQVTSPGGTTIAGLRAFEENGGRHALIETFLAAYKRSQELGS